MIRTFFAVAALLVMGATTATAQPLATSSDNTGASQSRVVRTGDLRLSSEAGARELLRRVHIAAASACTEEDAIYRTVDYVPCIAATTDEAVERLGNPVVAALHNHKPSGSVIIASVR